MNVSFDDLNGVVPVEDVALVVVPVWMNRAKRSLVVGVVPDHVEDKLHVATMKLSGQLSKLFIAPEARLDPRQVLNPVAVECPPLVDLVRAHFEDGGEPESGHPQLGQVVQFGADPRQIAAVERVRIGSLDRAVVGRIAVEESIHHDEVDQLSGITGVSGRC